MKSTGTQYWQAPNAGATNVSGFSGLPGGYRFSGGGSGQLGVFGHWWSASESGNSNEAWCRFLYNLSADLNRISYPKRDGFSVRCLRD